MGHGRHDDRQGYLTGGLILIGIGIYFLLWELDILPGLGQLWPIILIIVGLALIIGHFRRFDEPPEPPVPPAPPPPPERT